MRPGYGAILLIFCFVLASSGTMRVVPICSWRQLLSYVYMCRPTLLSSVGGN
ncbi:uncharacterized protein PSFLO_06755 [Pseudozyma flocculosa]|uniref:Uncharacterized protein n=1 Tax=Pseudozyma flocculosa TaxID=84751 RepID=A0A5C3F9Z7_9BASI|nr:uncharacterized protein PSFLO_06755 [Pseudozyma flocculosa]